jgi:hypothetical protein
MREVEFLRSSIVKEFYAQRNCRRILLKMASCPQLNTGNRLRLRIFAVTSTLALTVTGWPRKIGTISRKSGVFSVAYQSAQGHFHLLLTAPRNRHSLHSTYPPKGAFRMRSEMRGGCGACGRSRKPLPGDPGIDPAGITTGVRGASLKRDVQLRR